MAKYIVLIYETETPDGAPDPALAAEYAKHWSFMDEHKDAILAGDALQATSTATCLRSDGGTVTVTDGPFVETKEALGGFYVLEAPDLDAAIELAKEIPAPRGGVEIRPIAVFDA